MMCGFSQANGRCTIYDDEPRNHLCARIERSDKKPLITRCGEQSLKHRPNATYVNDEFPPFTIVGRQRELTKRLLAEKCECCGATNVPLEGHHVTKLADLKRRWQGQKHKPEWVKWMIGRWGRLETQIMLCAGRLPD